jgi:protein-glutamine gamma-glutamyltransferase
VKRGLRGPGGPVEGSIAMRVVVALAVELSILTVVAQGAVRPGTAALAIALAPVGYWVSYRRRGRSNLALKLALSAGLLAAMGQFLVDVQQAGNVDQARVPLATLFLWVQVMHAFDVPRRRDLAFSMVASLILMAEAGALSLTTGYGLFLVPWLGFAGGWLFLSSHPRADALTTPSAVRREPFGSRRPGGRLAPVRALSSPAAATVVAAFLVFLALPRVPGSFIKTPPFSLGRAATQLANFDGGVTNPSLPSADANGVVNFASGAYPGLSDVVDLRARGRLSDRIAFRVRATQPALWRAEAFDTYDGTRWTIGSTATQTLPAPDATGGVDLPPIGLVRGRGMSGSPIAGLRTVPLTQTFYLDTPQPNVLFAAANPTRVYFPSSGLRVDRDVSVRAPILLDRGLVYSVISELPVPDPHILRRAREVVPRALAAYLQLPDELPARVGDLARHIGGRASTEYDAVRAVQSYLQRATRYRLDVPADPPGVDEVDHFLFVTHEGFCEQIASSMAVMLRSLGIPTRLVTGYGPGERNPFTGYFEVKQSDAHAWVEVYYPGLGWVPYDPTFGVPAAAPGVASRFMAGAVFAAIGRFLGREVPEPVKRGVGAALGTVGVLAGALARAWPVAVAILLTASACAVLWRRRRRRGDPPYDEAEALFLEMEEALAAAGHPRAAQQTPGEYLGTLVVDPTFAPEVAGAALVIVRTFEAVRFAPGAPAREDVVRARASLGVVRAALGPRGRRVRAERVHEPAPPR